MRTTVLSIENALHWSWGLVIGDLIRTMVQWKFVRIVRRPKIGIDAGLLAHFPITLLQNVDNMGLIPSDKGKVVCRMGGMVLDKKTAPAGRYDKEIAQAGAVVATNKQLFDIGERVNANTHLIPNGVDTQLFRPSIHVKPRRKFTLGFAGNITGNGGNYKGWKYYVQACMVLEMEGGYGHIERLHGGPVGSNQQQIFHGDMVKEFYWNIDALILPTKGEGCSNVVGEALACGVPVLLTKTGYHGEMLTDGENCLFIERDKDDIASKVKMVKDDRALRKRLSENGRAFVEQNQNVAKIARAYDRVFRTIIRKG